MITKNNIIRKLLPILLAIAMLFGISMVAFAANGDGTGNQFQSNMAGCPGGKDDSSNIQLRICNPDVQMEPAGGTYSIPESYDSNDAIHFTISLNPRGGQKSFTYVDFSGTEIYAKDDIDKKSVASFGNGITTNPEPGVTLDNLGKNFNNERQTDLVISAGALDAGKEYCLFIPKTINSVGQGNKQLGVDVTVEFSTSEASSSVVESWVTGDCTATFYSDGLFVVEANDGGTGETASYLDDMPPWFETYGEKIKRAEIRNGVTKIGSLFFAVTPNLTSVSLPEGLTTIEMLAFYQNNLESVSFPSTIEYIGESAFQENANLSSMIFEDSSSDRLLTIEGLNTSGTAVSSWSLPERPLNFGWNIFQPPLKDIYIKTDASNTSMSEHSLSRPGTFHVKCSQLEAFKEKYSNLENATFEASHTNAEPVKENEVAATCTEEGSYDEVVYCAECNTEISREKKTIDALGHEEEKVPGKDPSCTETGLTEGTICSRCHVTLKEREEIPALGHDWEVIPEVISTCTKTGSTAGARCTRCGEYLIEPKEVPMIRHDYDDHGICTVCGAKDPDFVEPQEPTSKLEEPSSSTTTTTKKNEEPTSSTTTTTTTTKKSEEPSSSTTTTTKKNEESSSSTTTTTKKAEPVKKLNGLVKGPDEKWALYNDDSVQKSFTGLAKNENGWYYLKNGYVDWNYTGFAKNEKGWWRVENGKVNFQANSIYKQPSNGIWYKTTNGYITWDETGVFKNVNGWWRVENSRVNFYADGIYKNNNGWWKTTGGKVHFNETGIFKNENGTWYCKNSKVDFSKNGKVQYKGKTYTVTNGYAKLS